MPPFIQSNILCGDLTLYPKHTNMKWDKNRRNENLSRIINNDTAKSTKINGEQGVISTSGFVIGTDSGRWIYLINRSDKGVYVGLSSNEQSMSSIEGVSLSIKLETVQNDMIMFYLTSSQLNITHKTRFSAKKHILEISQDKLGQTLYPWVSTPNNGTMAVKIILDTSVQISIHEDKAIITNNNDEKLELGGPHNSITNTTSGASVEVDNDGNVDIDGGVSFKTLTIDDPITTLTLDIDDHTIIANNSATTSIKLPPAHGNNGLEYIIIRKFPALPGEVWTSPSLNVITDNTDSINGSHTVGVPENSSIQLICDGVDTWRII